jgi:hypothetical protein
MSTISDRICMTLAIVSGWSAVILLVLGHILVGTIAVAISSVLFITLGLTRRNARRYDA